MKKKLATRIGIGAVVVIAVLLVICPVISKPWRYLSIKRSVGVSEEEFMQKMEKLDEYYNTTKFSKNAEELLDYAQEIDYNEYIAPSIMCIAIDRGIDKKGTFNYWGKQPLYSMIVYDDGRIWPYEGEKVEEPISIVNGRIVPAYEYYISKEHSFEKFFSELDRYGRYERNFTYEKFSRRWTRNKLLEWKDCRTEKSDTFGKELYEKTQWIKSL